MSSEADANQHVGQATATVIDAGPEAYVLSAKRVRYVAYALIIVSTTAVLAGLVFDATPLSSANDRSRWSTVWSLVERGTYEIDEIQQRDGWLTIDKVRHEDHFYSSKPALLPTIVAGLYWSLQRVTEWNLLSDTQLVTALLLLVINVLPFGVAMLCLCGIVERYGRSDFTRLLIVVTAACGTLVTPFLTTFNNHTIAATSAVIALYALLRIWEQAAQARWWLFAAAGFFAAFTCVNELPAALFGVCAFLVCVRACMRKTLLAFIPCALIPLAAFFVTTWMSTGSWKPFYMYYGTEKYEYVFEGVPSYWLRPAQLDRATDTASQYLLHCTIGHHGILSLSPIFLLTLGSWCLLAISGRDFAAASAANRSLRGIVGLGLALTLAILLFYLSRPQNYNYGGNSAALRWTLWLVPFWLVALIPAVDCCGRWRSRVPVLALLAVSIFSSASVLSNPWRQPWLFNVMTDWEWIDYSDPVPEFERPRRTWISGITAFEQTPYWTELRGSNAVGELVTLRLEILEKREHGEYDDYRVAFRETVGKNALPAVEFWIDGSAYAQQRPLHEIVQWTAADVPAARRLAVLTWLHGVPYTEDSRVSYRRYLVRYVKTIVRTDAFECRRAVAQRSFDVASLGRKLRYRSDVWISDEVPFGIVDLQKTVYDDASGEILSRIDLALTATSADLSKPASETTP